MSRETRSTAGPITRTSPARSRGFGVRVVRAEALSALESQGQLPEVVVIGDRVLYEVRYEPDWTPCGARRIDTPRVIAAAATEIADLYDQGEPLLDFFDRELAPLPAPAF